MRPGTYYYRLGRAGCIGQGMRYNDCLMRLRHLGNEINLNDHEADYLGGCQLLIQSRSMQHRLIFRSTRLEIRATHIKGMPQHASFNWIQRSTAEIFKCGC